MGKLNRVFTNKETGKFSGLPWSKEQAAEYNWYAYKVPHPCGNPSCAANPNLQYVRYMTNDKCFTCLQFDQIALYNYFCEATNPHPHWDIDNWTTESRKDEGHFPPSDELTAFLFELQCLMDESPGSYKIAEKACKKGHLHVKRGDKCIICEREKEARKTTPRQLAIANGENWYVPDELCTTCNTKSPKSVANGRCKGCNQSNNPVVSPRQQAILNGDKWYTPDEPCPKCNTKSLKRVDNGTCKGCLKQQESDVTPRQQAILNGDKWYMPDEPCTKCGLKAHKYVANGRCKGCDDNVPPAKREALDRGENWYVPDEPCTTCKRQTYHHVVNGFCQVCGN